MGALTKRERDGLEDVFLSIHSNNKKFTKFKNKAPFFSFAKLNLYAHKLLKRVSLGLKEQKNTHFLAKYTKKKKNLSK